MTRGILNNNPCNIRLDPSTVWEGQVPPEQQTDKSFVQFTAPIYGLRAAARILMNYAKRGLTTVAKIINQWAPPNENNSEAYITDVCQDCSVQPDDVLLFPSCLLCLIKAIVNHENGSQPYADDLINQAVGMAQ